MAFLPRNKGQRPHSSQLRNEPTPAERRLWYGFLRTASPRWNRQRIIDSYIVDFFCHKAKLVVELDGSQHYDEHGLIEYDQIRTDYLEALELKVLRFTNEEIEKDFLGVCRRIQMEADQRLEMM
ncbi:endonuclease domain-containing protein [bacterium 1xD42-67]|nr:endonuclease domain-containing protein [Lawsonibacter sp.]RKI66489.1 endonuclease domain-containing protein [bacterium 1xD42-67]